MLVGRAENYWKSANSEWRHKLDKKYDPNRDDDQTDLPSHFSHTLGTTSIYFVDQLAAMACFSVLVGGSRVLHLCGECTKHMGLAYILVFSFLEFSVLILGAVLLLAFEWSKTKRFFDRLRDTSKETEAFENKKVFLRSLTSWFNGNLANPLKNGSRQNTIGTPDTVGISFDPLRTPNEEDGTVTNIHHEKNNSHPKEEDV